MVRSLGSASRGCQSNQPEVQMPLSREQAAASEGHKLPPRPSRRLVGRARDAHAAKFARRNRRRPNNLAPGGGARGARRIDFWRIGRKYRGAGLRGASRAIDPGAYKTRTGAVPDRGRGLGHMAPTYILVGTTRDLASNGSGGSATFISLRHAFAAAFRRIYQRCTSGSFFSLPRRIHAWDSVKAAAF